MIPSEQTVIQQTMQWIRDFVIELNLCPFARREMNRGSIRSQVSSATTIEDALLDFMVDIEVLNTDPDIETAFLLYPSCLNNFFDYLDFVDLANSTLLSGGYEGIYQLATFHPDYCFAGVSVDDVTHYTNRSPYPMLHILREANLERAISLYGNTEKIPEDNMARLRKLGLEEVKKLSLSGMGSSVSD